VESVAGTGAIGVQVATGCYSIKFFNTSITGSTTDVSDNSTAFYTNKFPYSVTANEIFEQKITVRGKAAASAPPEVTFLEAGDNIGRIVMSSSVFSFEEASGGTGPFTVQVQKFQVKRGSSDSAPIVRFLHSGHNDVTFGMISDSIMGIAAGPGGTGPWAFFPDQDGASLGGNISSTQYRWNAQLKDVTVHGSLLASATGIDIGSTSAKFDAFLQNATVYNLFTVDYVTASRIAAFDSSKNLISPDAATARGIISAAQSSTATSSNGGHAHAGST